MNPFRISIDPDRSKVVIHARATGHRLKTIFRGLGGRLALNPTNLRDSRGRIYMSMDQADAGDFLRTAQVKRFLNPSRFPQTVFDLAYLKIDRINTVDAAMANKDDMAFEVDGKVGYRGRAVDIIARGRGSLSEAGILQANCQFELDLRALNIEPPSFLFLKVNPEIEVEVELFGTQGKAPSDRAKDSRG